MISDDTTHELNACAGKGRDLCFENYSLFPGMCILNPKFVVFFYNRVVSGIVFQGNKNDTYSI